MKPEKKPLKNSRKAREAARVNRVQMIFDKEKNVKAK
jgi:hypothetical protein